MKVCCKCKIEKLSIEFYKNKAASDGLATYCKACLIEAAKATRLKNIDRYREYDRSKARDRAEYYTEYSRKYRVENREKKLAHYAVSSAIKRGKLKRLPWEECGAVKTEGHHDDYSKKLEVRWLCRIHHVEQHKD